MFVESIVNTVILISIFILIIIIMPVLFYFQSFLRRFIKRDVQVDVSPVKMVTDSLMWQTKSFGSVQSKVTLIILDNNVLYQLQSHQISI